MDMSPPRRTHRKGTTKKETYMSTAIDTEPNYEGVAKLQIARQALNEREDDAAQACDLAMSKAQKLTPCTLQK
jgi:hypothetical protein